MNQQDRQAFLEAADGWKLKSAGKDLGEYFWNAALDYERANQEAKNKAEAVAKVVFDEKIDCGKLILKSRPQIFKVADEAFLMTLEPNTLLYTTTQPDCTAESKRTAALCDLAYTNGAKLGWNLGVCGDEKRFSELMKSIPNIVRSLKESRIESPQHERTENKAKTSGVVGLVLAEIEKATAKFPTWPTDPMHALAVLGEEYGELNKAVLQCVYEPHKSTIDDVRMEAIQTAAMSIRFLMSLERYQYKHCEQHKQAALDAVQPDFSDAYQGAREDAEIWKKRALEAEELNRKFIAQINDETFMGEPAQPVQPAAAINAEHLEALRKRFVKLPKYSFLLNESGGVARVPDRSGAWVEWYEVHQLFDPVVADAAIAAAEAAKKGGV